MSNIITRLGVILMNELRVELLRELYNECVVKGNKAVDFSTDEREKDPILYANKLRIYEQFVSEDIVKPIKMLRNTAYKLTDYGARVAEENI